MGATSDHLEASFKRDVANILSQINLLMTATSPASIIGTQSLAIQHFASLLPMLEKIFDQKDLLEIASSFGDAIQPSTLKGRAAINKLLFLVQLVKSPVFESASNRAALIPSIARWTKPHLGKFDIRAAGTPKDSESVLETARIYWLEAARLAVTVIAVCVDKLQTALADPVTREDRSLTAQEQDNVEYILSSLPRLLETFHELESAANIELLQKHRSSASVVATNPAIFPANYPFSLISLPAVPNEPTGSRKSALVKPTFQSGLGEIGSLVVVMLLLAPPKILANFFEGAFEVEGSENFARFLSYLFRAARAILDNVAWPASWLNITILAHSVFSRLHSQFPKFWNESISHPPRRLTILILLYGETFSPCFYAYWLVNI